MMQDRNEQRWLVLWQRLGAQGDASAVYHDLVRRYSEPHRAYHTLLHIVFCLDELDQVRHLVANSDAVELALWYHDAVYDTRAKDNEEQSATLAVEMLKSAQLSDYLGHMVANLIMTTTHLAVPTNPDAKLLVDIDLAILGQGEVEFDAYEQQIRKEYDWVPEDAFIDGRSAVLESFLDRPNIYATQFFRDKYETQARQNISRSLAQLSDRS